MTAEERLAYFQGEKRREGFYGNGIKEKSSSRILSRLKFMMAVLLFVAFLSLDYTGYEIKGIGSERILKEVISDFDFTILKQLDL
jgi:hypothetical protein